jgi:CheY-like chemotaxis protein
VTDAVKQIDTSGRHLLQLIDEILDLSRIESGKLGLSIEPIDLGGLIEDVVATFQPMAIEAGITIHTAAPPRGLGAKGDHRRLRQVLLNLVSNAVKYNHRGGEVGVTCRELDGWAQIAVSDTGGGIPKHLMDDLFEPFNRLGQEQSPVVGSGVGLALCKRLVEAQNGWIRADSREGAGSTFTIGLPLAALPAASANAKAAIPDHSRATMLYVEDNPSNVLLMRHIVKEIDGVELLIATNPRDGIELARAVLPHLIILDINLPEMDGFDVLRILKAHPETAQIPVFALTANALPREVEHGRAAGFTRYLTKPINVPEFLDALGDMFEIGRPRVERARPAQPAARQPAAPQAVAPQQPASAPVKAGPVPVRVQPVNRRGDVVYASPIFGDRSVFGERAARS